MKILKKGTVLLYERAVLYWASQKNMGRLTSHIFVKTGQIRCVQVLFRRLILIESVTKIWLVKTSHLFLYSFATL